MLPRQYPDSKRKVNHSNTDDLGSSRLRAVGALYCYGYLSLHTYLLPTFIAGRRVATLQILENNLTVNRSSERRLEQLWNGNLCCEYQTHSYTAFRYRCGAAEVTVIPLHDRVLDRDELVLNVEQGNHNAIEGSGVSVHLTVVHEYRDSLGGTHLLLLAPVHPLAIRESYAESPGVDE